MTDRYKGCTVTFTQQIREDDAESLLNAIAMIKGVAQVTPSLAVSEDHITRMKVYSEVRKKLYDLIDTLEK